MKQKYLILLSLIGFLISSDQLFKIFITRFALEDGSWKIGNLIELLPIRNNGLIFNLMNRAPASLQDTVYIGIPLIALILIVLIFIKLQNNQMTATVALTLILGGAASNLLDRLQFNSVLDICKLTLGRFTFSFNVADIYIFAGIILMAYSTINLKRQTATV